MGTATQLGLALSSVADVSVLAVSKASSSGLVSRRSYLLYLSSTVVLLATDPVIAASLSPDSRLYKAAAAAARGLGGALGQRQRERERERQRERERERGREWGREGEREKDGGVEREGERERGRKRRSEKEETQRDELV